MAKRIYYIAGLVALAFLIFLLVGRPATVSTLVWMVTLTYAVMIGSVHGIVSHSLAARQKGSLSIYPVFMGAIFAVLAFIYFYLVLPLVIPGYF